jgi:four helix bundle protein
MLEWAMNFEEWLNSVPESITKDSLWSFETYRKALFLSDLAWLDCEKLSGDTLGKGIAWQLIDSAGSIAANIEEGYGRGFGKDYARFLRIALGSARESRGWYYRGRRAFNPDVLEHRMRLLDEIIAGLVSAAKMQRKT